MPGGNGNIRPSDNPKPFTKDYQPTVRGRNPSKFLTELLVKELQSDKEMVMDAIDAKTGEKVRVKVPLTTKDKIVKALLRKGAKGDIPAIKEIFDRVEGKVTQVLDVQGNVAGTVAIGLPANGRDDPKVEPLPPDGTSAG